MNKRFIYFILSLIFLLTVFLFVEDKVENQTEVNYWKENWKSIRFFPPKKTWCGNLEPAFIDHEIQMELFDRGWKKPPTFSVSSINPETNEKVIYEGNYNVKNSFSDLSVLKTKFIEQSTIDTYEKYCVNEDAPRINLSLDSFDLGEKVVFRSLFFGKKMESDTSRIISRDGDQLISPYAYLLEKFRGKEVSLRERQFVTFSGGYIKTIDLTGQGLNIKAENNAKKNQYETYVNQWSRLTGERIVLPPDIGNDWETKVKSLRADLYPDDESGPGFLFTKEWKNASPEITLFITHSDKYSWKISVYPKIDWKKKTYRPVIREIQPFITESVSFISEESFQNLIQSALKVKNASRFERPNQKIQ